MSVGTDNNAANAATSGAVLPGPAESAVTGGEPATPDAVERALAAAIQDASKIGDLLDTLRSARLWLPLPACAAGSGTAGSGTASPDTGAVTLPTVVYLGCEFIPAYTSADLLTGLADPAAVAGPPGALVPHIVVRAADLAGLMPPDVGIALNAGASQSVPVYPQGVAFLAADEPTDDRRITVGPLPVEPEDLLAAIRAGLACIPQARRASAGWLSVQFAGEGMIVSVTLDDPSDARVRDQVIAALERAARDASHHAGYPIDVTFPGEGEPDHIDHWIATGTEPFYVRA